MRNKNAQIGDFISLFIATLIIAAILVLFVVLTSVVKSIEGEYNGEKVYRDVEVGVGGIIYYMFDYECFVRAESLVRKGEDVNDAFDSAGCGKSLLPDTPQVLMGRHEK